MTTIVYRSIYYKPSAEINPIFDFSIYTSDNWIVVLYVSIIYYEL